MRGILVIAALVLTALPAWAQTRDENVARCTSAATADNVDLKINACTALLQSGAESATNIPIIYYDRGNAYHFKGLNDQAIGDFTQAIALRPDYANAYNNRAGAYHLSGQDAQGLADANRALSLAGPNAARLETRASIEETLGQRDNAIADYRAALQLDPNDENSRAGLKRLGITP